MTPPSAVYVVCARCAHVWLTREARCCEHCGHTSLVACPTIAKAEEVSQAIIEAGERACWDARP